MEYKGIGDYGENIQLLVELKLQELLDEYGDLFKELTKLPSKRIQDHVMRLILLVQPPNIWSYGYTYY